MTIFSQYRKSKVKLINVNFLDKCLFFLIYQSMLESCYKLPFIKKETSVLVALGK